jgi:hypothetical protein
MSDDFDILLSELDGIGEAIEDVVTVTLPELARTLANEVTIEIFKVKEDQTYALRDSIKSTVQGNRLTFEMLDYGYYQTFGVNPASGQMSDVFGLPEGIASQFGKTVGGKFSFKSERMKNHPGFGGVKAAKNILENIDDIIINEIL